MRRILEFQLPERLLALILRPRIIFNAHNSKTPSVVSHYISMHDTVLRREKDGKQ